jgi:hypothetical protein
MKMLSPILQMQQLQQSKTCTLIVFHIRHTHQTWPMWLPHVQATRRCNGRKGSVWWRGTVGNAWAVAQTTATILF